MSRRSVRLRANNANQNKPPAADCPQDLVESSKVVSPPALCTPRTLRPRASFEEMHPSHTAHSTTKELGAEVVLGFLPTHQSWNAGHSSKTAVFASMQDTPTKARTDKPKVQGKPGVVAGGIKAASERKIAAPTSRIHRFSDVHRAEFGKMSSIAGHPSAFRARLEAQPRPAQGIKRKVVEAALGDNSELPTPRPLPEPPTVDAGARKRARVHAGPNNFRLSRPARGRKTRSQSPSSPCVRPTQQSGMLATISTPTKASLARTASTQVTGSLLPSVTMTPSLRAMRDAPKPATVDKKEPTGGKAGVTSAIKSILRRPSRTLPGRPTRWLMTPVNRNGKDTPLALLATPLWSEITAASPLPAPSPPPSPGPPSGISVLSALRTPDTLKRVTFSPSTKSVAELSPSVRKSALKSAMKSPASSSRPRVDRVQYPTLPTLLPEDNLSYPVLPAPDQANMSSPPKRPTNGPGFAFRASQTLDFGRPVGRAARTPASTIRAVRPSISEPAGAAIAHGTATKKRRRAGAESDEEDDGKTADGEATSENKENETPMPPSKRQRMMATTAAFSDAPAKRSVARGGIFESPRKPAVDRSAGHRFRQLASTPRRRLQKPQQQQPPKNPGALPFPSPAELIARSAPRRLQHGDEFGKVQRGGGNSIFDSAVKRPAKSSGVISMARLNALARPKERK
ncbi:MAG: hypothetical protein M1825_006410 [Sarcosagium campestre]|nr:MAG: hypothetical protein M1825_006410 [Sarcosagium campestre]